MDISIIVVTWNSAAHIARCLASLAHATKGIHAEIIVVDNASSDGTAAAVRDRFPGVALIRLPSNAGFARACNIGIAHARGRYVGFLNPDAEVLGDGFSHVVRFLDARPRAAIAGGRLLNADHTVQHSVHVFPTPLSAFAVAMKLHRVPFLSRHFRGGFETASLPKKSTEVDYVKGAFFVARTSFLEEAGGFDERYFLWFDEADLQRTAHERGWEVWHYPKSQALHAGAKSFAQADEWRNQKQFLKSMGQYVRKWHGAWGALPVWIVTPFVLAAYRVLKGREESI